RVQPRLQSPEGLDQLQAGADSTLGLVSMGLRIAKVDQEPIPQILGDMAAIALDHFGTRRLVGTYHLAVVFRVKLTGEARGVHEVAEQHGELAAFGLRRLRFGWCDGRRANAGGQRDRWLRGLRGCRRWRWDSASLTTPDQAAACRINNLWVREEDGILEGLK